MCPLSVNHPSARKFWAMDLSKSIAQDTFFYKAGLVKKASDPNNKAAVIIQMDELNTPKMGGKASGYEIDYDLEGPLSIIPTSGDNPVKGKEKKLKLYSDKIQINQDRVSVIDDGQFADGLVPYEFRERAKERLATQQWPTYYDERFIIKMSGSVGSGSWLTIDPVLPSSSARNIDGSVASDGNDLRAPSVGRAMFGATRYDGSVVTSVAVGQAAMSASDVLSLDVVDQAILAAARPASNSSNYRLMPPLIIGGRKAYILLCDYVTLQYMNANTSGRFYDLERARVQGGMKDSALLDFASYVYRSPMGYDVYFVAHPNLVKFSATATGSVKVVRNLLLGHSAARIATGREAKELPQYSWHEETDDRGNQLVITSGTTVGIQKCAFNTTETGTTTEDWAVMAIDTYGDW